jgi:ADP-ribose pyrophosphatase YjhB (NUDIX family)
VTDAVPQVTRLGAYAVAVDDEARILLCRIAPGYPAAGTWTLPGGGVEFGEDPNEAVVRELDEETGLSGRPEGVLGIWSRRFERTETRRGALLHFVGILYRVTPDPGEIRIEVDGSTDLAAWFTPDELGTIELGDLAVYGVSLVAGWPP